jgi:hypothetical protein
MLSLAPYTVTSSLLKMFTGTGIPGGYIAVAFEKKQIFILE